MSTFCHFCTGRTPFQRVSAKCTTLYKTAFPARRQHVLSFSHRAQHFLPVLSKVCQFLQNSVFRPRSEPFVIFALGKTVFSCFQQSAKVCTKQYFQPEISTFCHFCTECTNFSQFQQTKRVCKKQRFQHEISTFCQFCTGHNTSQRFLSKVHEFVQNRVSSPRSARFVIFALDSPVFSDFKSKYTSLYKTAYPARDQHIFSILHWAQQFIAVFSQVYEFVQNSVFNPRSARFVIFALRALLFGNFQQRAQCVQNSVFSLR